MSTFNTPRGKRKVQSKAVAVTAPAHVVQKLLRPLVPEVNRTKMLNSRVDVVTKVPVLLVPG